METIWKDVVGYEGLYSVSNDCRVRSEDRTVTLSNGRKRRYKGKVLSEASPSKVYPYPKVALSKDGKGKTFSIHQLVAEAFLGPCPDGMEVCHIDGDALNSTPENLRYDTRSENITDMVGHGTHNNARKTHCKRGHAFSSANTKPVRGGRLCRSCSHAHKVIYKNPLLKGRLQSIADSYYSALN